MITSKGSSLLILSIIFALFITSEQAIPTIVPDNSLLNAQSNYIMSYFSLIKLTSSSYFQIDFSQSDILVTDGNLNVSVNLNGSPMNSSTITSNCTNKVCIIKLGAIVNANTNIETTFGLLKNPKFTATQKVNVFVFFETNSNQTQTVFLSSSIYMPMPVIVNSVTQSDYGVGSFQVTYTFNVSFSYIPTNPEISIQIPLEVGYTNIDTNLTFYGTYQAITPFLTTNMIILSVQSAQMINPNGFMLLTLYGFRNPRFIGNSNSFNVSMVQKRTSFSNNCVTCRVAYLYLNSSKLLIVSSTTPGDITMNMFTPSSNLVSQNISLTIGIKIVAPIPDGGKFRIILPTGITPSLPITCTPVYGFTVTNPAYCLYNSTTNTIQTVNYSIPYLQSTGDAIILINVINAKDNRQSFFNFETLDDQNRKIGKSRTPFLYTAAPLVLNTIVSKNTTFIESGFTLSSTVTLQQAMNLTTDVIVVTLPPSNYYNTTAIQCNVSSIIVPCKPSFDNFTNNLLITFTPPLCPSSICPPSIIIPILINNLINPSFINDKMNNIMIQTMSSFGVMQTFNSSILLQQKYLNVSLLNWVGNQVVGSQYIMSLVFQLPRYTRTNGGYLLINFDQNSSYINLVMSSNTSFSYPQSLTVINENNQPLINTLTYYNTSHLWSIKQIKIKLCTSDSPCGNNLTISILRKPFYPLQSSTMTIKGQTLNGQPIATSTSDTSQFLPIALTNVLSITSSTSVTNTLSSYIMKFKMNKLPFDTGMRIQLSSRHKIQDTTGRCFVELSPSNVLGYGIDCKINNSTSVILTYSGNVAIMTAYQIDYTITIVNVLNPPSTMPITYKLQPLYNSIKSGTISASYAIAQPYTLTVDQLVSSNSTYGQVTNLTIKLSTGYYPFDQLRVYVPKENYNIFYSLSSGNSNSSSNLTTIAYNMTQNTTHFILSKIYTIDSILTLKLNNALSTSATSKIITEMYVQGYLSSYGVFNLPRITPVYLFTTVSSTNRYVGQSTSLVFDVRRVNSFVQQQYIKVLFNNTVFTIPTVNQLFTIDNNNTQLYSYSQTLSIWTNITTKLINLNTFQNMKYIPNSVTLSALPKLNISTYDNMNSIVATTLIDLIDIVPNKIRDAISYTFVRTTNQSMNYTDIVIDYIPRYAQMAKLIKIQLPLNENKFISNLSTCTIGDATKTATNSVQATNSVVNCVVVDMQNTAMTIQYPTTTTINQTRITLKDVLNQYPTNNNLTITLLTLQSQLIQQSFAYITPVIDLDPLTLTATTNTTIVSSPVQMNITITSPENMINQGSIIKLTFPDKIYSRVALYSMKDCQYQISGVKFTGCRYQIDNNNNDNKQWIQYIIISNFTNVILQPGTPFTLTLYLINPSTTYTISSQQSISTMLYNSFNQPTSTGSINLTTIYPNLLAFTPVQLPTYILQQTNKLCGQTNTLNISITLPVNIATLTSLYVIIPIAYFVTNNQTGYDIQSVNTTHYKLKRVIITECTTTSNLISQGLCMKTGDTLSAIITVSNQQYLSLINPKPIISMYLYNDNNYVTSTSQLVLNQRIPNSLANTILQRSNTNIAQTVMSTLRFTLPTTFNINNNTLLKVSITPTISPIRFIQSITSTKLISNKQQNGNSTQTINNNNNIQLNSNINGREITLLINNTNLSSLYDIQIIIDGLNPMYVPNIDNESYQIKIYDDLFVYFVTNSVISIDNKLKPLTNGVTLTRSTTIVNTLSTYYISANLPTTLLNAKIIFNQTTSIIIPNNNNNASSLYLKNITLNQFTNPMSSNWQLYQSVSIMNDTHILFRNNKIKTIPELTSLQMPNNSIISVVYNKNMKVNTQQVITVMFEPNVLTNNNVTKVNIKIPTFFTTVKQCKITTNTQQQTIVSCKSTPLTTTTTLIQIPLPTSNYSSSSQQSITQIQLTIYTQAYQQIYNTNSSTIIIQTQYPTKYYQQSFGLNLWGGDILTQLTMKSYKVNDMNDIKLKITPLIKSDSQLVVYLPSYINTQLQTIIQSSTNGNTSSSYVKLIQGALQKYPNLQFNTTTNTYFFIYSLSTLQQNITLLINNLTNPISNQPYNFIIEQQQISPQNHKIFGHSIVEVKMTTLEQIIVKSAQRNTSKIAVNVQIMTQIQIPSSLKQQVLQSMAQQSCIISMPTVQVNRLSLTSQCQVLLLGVNTNTSLPCQMHPNITNAIITTCSQGTNKYLIKKGFKNMLYSILPNATHKPYVLIGSQYQLAESTLLSTPFLTPIMTSGSLNLNSLTTSSLKRLQKTKLNLNITLENIQQVDFINFRFEKQNYLYSTNDLKCTSNGQLTDCWSVEIGSIMVNISSIQSQNLAIQIQGLSNYLRQSNFTIKTLKYLTSSNSSTTRRLLQSSSSSDVINVQSAPQTSFALVDIFYSSPNDIGTPFTSNSYNLRVIVPDNYVSQEQKQIKIFFDDQYLLPSSLSKNLLQFNITTNIPSCQLLNAQFSTSFTMKCMFNQSIAFNLAVSMFDKSYADVNLAENAFTTFIYPPLSDTCKNQLCDKCSTSPDGIQKCFSCRENFYQYQNTCIESCPTGFTSYDISMSCQQCSSQCSTCYALQSNNCIKCQNSTLVSDNGQCSQTCTTGYAENGFCIGDQQCFDNGCRLCGTNGFCYQCLPDYSGQPQCQWQQLLPSLFMSFFAAPFLIYAVVSTIFFLVTKGALTMTNQVIFAFSLVEFTVSIFIIPALHTKQQAMVLLSLIILRIVIGIVAYETYYKKQINSHIGVNEQQSLLEQEKSSQKQSKHQKQSNKQLQGPSHYDEDWKTRLIRFLAHTNGIDTYEEFKVLFMNKVRIEHNNMYLWLSTGNRLLICVLMFYVFSQMKGGDLTIMPIAAIVSSIFVLSLRLVKSEKFQKVWERVRSSTK